MIESHTETESKFIVILALYILKENGDVLVDDTFNGIYLNHEKLQELQQIIIQSQKNTKNNNKIEKITIITLLLSYTLMITFAFTKMVVPAIVSSLIFLICILLIIIIWKKN